MTRRTPPPDDGAGRCLSPAAVGGDEPRETKRVRRRTGDSGWEDTGDDGREETAKELETKWQARDNGDSGIQLTDGKERINGVRRSIEGWGLQTVEGLWAAFAFNPTFARRKQPRTGQ